MKNLEVSLVVRAENTNQAESIAMRELLELAKVIAKRNGGAMGQGSGGATPLASDAYQVNATVSIDSKRNVNDIIKDIQNVWRHKPEIVHSMFTVEEEKQEVQKQDAHMVKCECCGGMFNEDDTWVINVATDNEYYLCTHCLNGEADVKWCDKCEWHVGERVENPVTHEKNICPCCGETM